MIEAVLQRKSNVVVIPVPGDTGPGPGAIVKNSTDEDGDGYFGSLASEEFITATGLKALTALTTGTLSADDPTWHKFFVAGKVVFIPEVPLYTGVSWTSLNSVGLVYGSPVTVQGYSFILRLVRGDKTDPTSLATSANYANPTFPWSLDKDTEWGRTLVRLSSARQQYADLTDTQLGVDVGGTTNGSWCQETYPETANAALRGANTVNAYYVRSKTGGRCWRPALELITA